MTPPPDSGDKNMMDDDPLGGMDPMAWLESLARRQGANPDELVTGGNLELSASGADAEPADEAVGEPAVGRPAEPLQPMTTVPEISGLDEVTGGMDPMAWLESLARRQGANPDELMTGGDLEIPAPTLADEPPAEFAAEPAEILDGNDPMAWLQGISSESLADLGLPGKPETPETPEPAAVGEDDPLGGMDPMAWLESLARRQGASPDELVTGGDLELPTPGAAEIPETPVAEPPAMAELEAESEVPPEPATAGEPLAAAEPSLDFLGGMDPMAWLEQLAAAQGAPSDELITVGKADQPEIPSVEPVEPGAAVEPMQPETPIPQAADAAPEPLMTADEAAALVSEEATPAPVPMEDPMAWLESLARGEGDATFSFDYSAEAAPSSELSDIDALEKFAASTPIAPESEPISDATLAWLEELARAEVKPAPSVEEIRPLDYKPEPVRTTEDPQMAGGLSDDPNEVQAWLERQLHSLEATREELERLEETPDVEAPAETGEIPDWLRESMPKDLGAVPEPSVLSEEIKLPDVTSELPPWLQEGELEAAALNFSVQDLDFITPPEEEQAVAEAAPLPSLSAEELEELTRPASPEEIDPWAEALDEEYERRLAGDETVPDWYLEAVARLETAPAASVAGGQIEPEPEAATLDWLEQLEPVEEEAQTELAAELTEAVAEIAREPAEPVIVESIPEYAERRDMPVADVLPGTIPDWLKAVATESLTPAAEGGPTTEPPPWFSPQPAPAVAETPLPQPKPEKTAQPVAPAAAPRPAADLPGLLAGARRLVSEGQLLPALEQYQALVDSSSLLEETRGDLRDLAEKNPTVPKIFRLLGDAHMRLGDLETALQTYLSALDQL